MKKFLLTIFVLTNIFTYAQDVFIGEVIPCEGRISKISTAHLVEYGSVKTDKGVSLYVCHDNNNKLVIHSRSKEKISPREIAELMMAYESQLKNKGV